MGKTKRQKGHSRYAAGAQCKHEATPWAETTRPGTQTLLAGQATQLLTLHTALAPKSKKAPEDIFFRRLFALVLSILLDCAYLACPCSPSA